jgi:hypothetical protein
VKPNQRITRDRLQALTDADREDDNSAPPMVWRKNTRRMVREAAIPQQRRGGQA